MISKSQHEKIYRQLTNLLSDAPMKRNEIIDKMVSESGLSCEELKNDAVCGAKNAYRSKLGTILTEMLSDGVIKEDNGGFYSLAIEKPTALRIERCEREIIRLITATPMTKKDISGKLTELFGTKKTPSRKDDGRLAEFINKSLERLKGASIISFVDGRYTLSKSASARADDLNEMARLKSEFFARLHAKGGEFFEHYFMTLLSKYLTKMGKKVIECSVTGGTHDGGIDGIAKTVDSLGFKETIMVQTKNRIVVASETDVRGFYGAVCAARGTRGIYAITSTFHSAARKFLDSIDECVGVDADRIFAMAYECLYGIRRAAGKLQVDEKII